MHDAPMRVVVIDDHPELLNLVKVQLTASGHEVLTADNGTDGVALATTVAPDAVVCDLSMPDLDGFEVAALLRGHRATWLTPIVLITTSGAPDDRARALKQGVDDFVPKPFSPADLEERIGALVRRSRQGRGSSESAGLPGRAWLMQHLDRRLQKGEAVGLACCEVDDLDAFRDRHGDARSAEVVRFICSVLSAAADEIGAPADLVAHFGGAMFAYAGAPASFETVLRSVIERFDRAVRGFYDEAEQAQGGIVLVDPLGVRRLVPFMRLSVGACVSERRALRTAIQMSEVCNELKRAALQLSGSAYLIDRRREHRGPSVKRAATA